MSKLIILFLTIMLSLTSMTTWASEEANPNAITYSPKYKQFPPPPPEAEPEYFKMEKNVVNFRGEGKAHFLAVDLEFLSYYPQLVGEDGEMEHLRPILKNDLDRILRNTTYTELSAPDGANKLRAKILKATREVLEKFNIYPDLLKNVYITRLVMQ